MSKGRRALLRKLLDQRKQRKVVWVGLKLPLPEWAWDTSLFATLAPGEIRKTTSGASWMSECWIGRSEDGTQFYQTLGAVVQGAVRGRRRITEEEVVAHVREVLAQKVEAAKNASPPRPPAVQEAKPAVVRTRLARCLKCRQRFEAPAAEDVLAICPICRTGGA